jgi:hypothetical protein
MFNFWIAHVKRTYLINCFAFMSTWLHFSSWRNLASGWFMRSLISCSGTLTWREFWDSSKTHTKAIRCSLTGCKKLHFLTEIWTELIKTSNVLKLFTYLQTVPCKIKLMWDAMKKDHLNTSVKWLLWLERTSCL